MDPYDPYPPIRSARRKRRNDLFDDDGGDGDGSSEAGRTGVPGHHLTANPFGPNTPHQNGFAQDAGQREDEPIRRRRPAVDTGLPDEPAWSTWLDAVHGPQPFPKWVVTDLGAIDTELGLLKTGKEADVHLVERAVPGGARSWLAAKRYRSSEHRLFHRDAGYLEGRRVRRSRETRAMATRTGFGRELLAGQWARAEFGALSRLWELGRREGGVRVPYPVQLLGTELLLEFVRPVPWWAVVPPPCTVPDGLR